MALTPLTTSNSFIAADGRIGTFVGPTAGNYQVGRLDLTGTAQTTGTPFTTPLHNILIVWVGDSHIAGSVQAGPPYQNAPLLTLSGCYVPYDQANQNYAVGGYSANQILTTSVPLAVSYINANKAGKTLVIAMLEGVINSTTYAAYSAKQSIINDIRSSGNALAATGAKVILITTPPSHNNEATAPAQVPIIDQLRTEIDADFIANTALYGAVAVTASHTTDAELYPLRAYQTYPDRYADPVHYSFLGQGLWGNRHVLPVLLSVAYQYSVLGIGNPGVSPFAIVYADTYYVTTAASGTATRNDGLNGFGLSAAYSRYALGLSAATVRGQVSYMHNSTKYGAIAGLARYRTAGNQYTDIVYGFQSDSGSISVFWNGAVVAAERVANTTGVDILLEIIVGSTTVTWKVGGAVLGTHPLDTADASQSLNFVTIMGNSFSEVKNVTMQGDKIVPAWYYEPTGTIVYEEDNALVTYGTGWPAFEAKPAAYGGQDRYNTVDGSYYQTIVQTGKTQLQMLGFCSTSGGAFSVTVNGTVVRTGTHAAPFEALRPYFATIANLTAGDVVRLTKTSGIAIFADRFKQLP